MKRIIDIFASAFMLILLFPFGLVIALLIACDSRGGVFYRQSRVGRYNRDFTLYKFRTMRTDADRLGLLTVGARDPRVTRVGYYLRKYKIDELPQLLNILSGGLVNFHSAICAIHRLNSTFIASKHSFVREVLV